MSPLNACQERIVCTYCVSQVTASAGKAQIKPSLPILFTSLFQPTKKDLRVKQWKNPDTNRGEKNNNKKKVAPLFIRLWNTFCNPIISKGRFFQHEKGGFCHFVLAPQTNEHRAQRGCRYHPQAPAVPLLRTARLSPAKMLWWGRDDAEQPHLGHEMSPPWALRGTG